MGLPVRLERQQLTGSACNSHPLGTSQCAFIHRQHKGFHDGLLNLDLFSSVVQVVFLTGLGWPSLCKTKQMQLTPSHCHCRRVLQMRKQGDGRSVILFKGCNTSLPQTSSEMQQDSLCLAGSWKKPSSAYLHQVRRMLYQPFFWAMPQKFVSLLQWTWR